MALDGHFRPTLLVGIGGTGSKIAETILETARKNDRALSSRIGILALDTDLNSLNDLQHVERRSRIAFSRPETIYRLLERNAGVERTWCYARNAPEMSEAIRGMSLIEGAGQIRMLTRLALHDAFAHDGLMITLEDAISRLGVHDSEQDFAGSIHVLVVGSLAGATGSGAFAQLALAIKLAAREREVNATVRGVFLLPDVYARGGSLPRTQIPNVLANGYASLKELNAFNVLASLPQRRANFTFEYAPGQILRQGEMPYSAVTFIDYENSTGGSMGRGLTSYIDMASRAGYLMIFSPLGANYGSVTVNDVRQKLAAASSGTNNLYSGIGVAAVNYPIDSMRSFLAKRLVLENLRGDWTRLDTAFRNQIARYKEQLADGRSAEEEPDIRETYIRDLHQLAHEEPRIPFFRRVYDTLFPEIEDEHTYERTVRPLHTAYASAVGDYAVRTFWNEGDMAAIRQRSAIDSSSLIDSGGLVDTVRRAEAELDRDFRSLEAALQSRPDDIFLNATVSADNLGQNQWAAHHLQAYLIQNSPHPVAVRAFLFHLRKELQARLAAIDTRDLRRKLFGLANIFRDDAELQANRANPSTRSSSRVIDLATEAEGGGLLTNILGNKTKKRFAGDYVTYYNSTVLRMREYAEAMIREKVYSLALHDCEELIRVFAGLFAEIAEIGGVLNREIDQEKAAYTGRGGNDGNTFVYADADCKEDAWKRLNTMAAGLKLDDTVNRRLVEAVYTKYREDRRARRSSSFKDIRELFWENVVIRFGQTAVDEDYRSVFDFSVAEAMRRQFAVEDQIAEGRGDRAEGEDSYARRMREIVDRVSRQSEPFLSFVNPDADGTPIKFWTIHPDVKAAINNNRLFEDMFIVRSGDNPIEKPEFSPYELICVNLRVNVELRHLTKLHMGSGAVASVHERTEGRLADAYNGMVARMIAARRGPGPGAEFTPHVDKTWHLPGVLPEIFSELDERISEDSASAFAAALLLGLLRRETEYGEPQVRFTTRGQGMPGAMEEIIGQSHDVWQMFRDFTHNTPVVHATREFWDHAHGRSAGSLTDHPAFAPLTDPARLIELFKLVVNRIDDTEARDETAVECLEAWIGLLQDLVAAQQPTLSPRGHRLEVQKLVDRLRPDLMESLHAEGYGPEMDRIFERVLATAYDNMFAA
ncbi:MAG: hypothetical protein KDC18_09120 [Alphaproteobacteria bacterium]|nr:hypothetical protein [Alphaproteobacteria bacterium]MCB9930770.1 hypothetical protein [Alphaproteobacteria bacterium]